MESSLVIELTIASVDIGYFVGLTPVENSQIQSGQVKRWIHIGDKSRNATNFNNFAQKKAQFILHERKNCEYPAYTYLLLWIIISLNHVRMEQPNML